MSFENMTAIARGTTTELGRAVARGGVRYEWRQGRLPGDRYVRVVRAARRESAGRGSKSGEGPAIAERLLQATARSEHDREDAAKAAPN